VEKCLRCPQAVWVAVAWAGWAVCLVWAECPRTKSPKSPFFLFDIHLFFEGQSQFLNPER
jgi:hypothetical protein